MLEISKKAIIGIAFTIAALSKHIQNTKSLIGADPDTCQCNCRTGSCNTCSGGTDSDTDHGGC
jgi:hypothetical protein